VIALLFSAVWIQSIGYTSGGLEISTRVLSPVWVVLSITGAGILEPLTRRAWWRAALVAAILLCQIWTAAQGVFYPDNPLSLPLVQWRQRAFQRVKPPVEFQIRDQVSKVFPPGSRILSDGPYLHAALIDKGIEVVPIWSPEVRFLFSSSPEESERQLRSLRVVSVTYCPISLSTDFMVSMSPFYASLTQRWRILAQVPGSLYFYVPKQH
jgi:hypothetical protein